MDEQISEQDLKSFSMFGVFVKYELFEGFSQQRERDRFVVNASLSLIDKRDH